jgi:hypothetical protein
MGIEHAHVGVVEPDREPQDVLEDRKAVGRLPRTTTTEV